ncbi:hypothetical protein RPPS3_25280 [Rhodopseudomonas palustris]|uniref:hypothetical protein n=1 Tax=Rhodopseudomonas palustris TaxID=1076 RepID=UPI000D1AC51C|nr:hypothetical protein [Rhodopseudomonas palustris]AVT76591.1 hypothetical protein RPPS3_25280 [Rhodopseudomonas palustris]
MALEIIVSLNGRPIATACAVNISDLAKLSDYKVTAFETASAFTPAASNTFKIEAHNHEQSCWALVEKIASRAKVNPGESSMSQTSIKPEFARANGPNCVGCIEEKADVMLTFGFGTNFTDVFLDRRLAASFHEELGRVLSSIPISSAPDRSSEQNG